MKTTIGEKRLFLIVLFFGVVLLGAFAQQGSIVWEYRVFSFSSIPHSWDIDQELRNSGKMGWELVQIIQSGDETILIFKRPKAQSY